MRSPHPHLPAGMDCPALCERIVPASLKKNG